MDWSHVVEQLDCEIVGAVLEEISADWAADHTSREAFFEWAKTWSDRVLARGQNGWETEYYELKHQLKTINHDIVRLYVTQGAVDPALAVRRSWLGHLIDVLAPQDGSDRVPRRRIYVRKAA